MAWLVAARMKQIALRLSRERPTAKFWFHGAGDRPSGELEIHIQFKIQFKRQPP